MGFLRLFCVFGNDQITEKERENGKIENTKCSMTKTTKRTTSDRKKDTNTRANNENENKNEFFFIIAIVCSIHNTHMY